MCSRNLNWGYSNLIWCQSRDSFSWYTIRDISLEVADLKAILEVLTSLTELLDKKCLTISSTCTLLQITVSDQASLINELEKQIYKKTIDLAQLEQNIFKLNQEFQGSDTLPDLLQKAFDVANNGFLR